MVLVDSPSFRAKTQKLAEAGLWRRSAWAWRHVTVTLMRPCGCGPRLITGAHEKGASDLGYKDVAAIPLQGDGWSVQMSSACSFKASSVDGLTGLCQVNGHWKRTMMIWCTSQLMVVASCASPAAICFKASRRMSILAHGRTGNEDNGGGRVLPRSLSGQARQGTKLAKGPRSRHQAPQCSTEGRCDTWPTSAFARARLFRSSCKTAGPGSSGQSILAAGHQRSGGTILALYGSRETTVPARAEDVACSSPNRPHQPGSGLGSGETQTPAVLSGSRAKPGDCPCSALFLQLGVRKGENPSV